ncbi:NWD1-like protein [Mya arenaria]|uniref:NWD1-like protein n=1 Tax=Mya arenaria TaxID=6604 RepID=A0ABY7FNM8_MYAAR|nr:NWD1-like protein [Mya arenaria]
MYRAYKREEDLKVIGSVLNQRQVKPNVTEQREGHEQAVGAGSQHVATRNGSSGVGTVAPGTAPGCPSDVQPVITGQSASKKEMTPEQREKILKTVDGQAKKAALGNEVVGGNMGVECPPSAKIVRIFTSSTFTDTKHERNMLMKYAYPKVKEATDDHMGTELCLKELALCRKLSTGPSFVSLLSHKYGYTAFPRVIEAGEFQTLMEHVTDADTKTLFDKWYRLDDNNVPASYVLSSISTNLPDFISTDREKQKVAKQQWWEESGKMQDWLDAAARAAFDHERARKFIMSVTETEVEEGLLTATGDAVKCALWLKRDIDDIENQEKNYALSRYMECLGPTEKVERAQRMLRELKEQRMQKVLSPDQILNYHVTWSGGIDPDANAAHRKYLDSMCEDFVRNMVSLVEQAVKAKNITHGALPEEILQHVRMCQAKCETFQGREEILEKIKAYVTDTGNTKPLVLHGASGTGKTSIMAMVAKQARTWLNNNNAVVMLRFLGTTRFSSSVVPLLYSLLSQIIRVFGLKSIQTSQVLELLKMRFKLTLKAAKPTKPLVLIIDSLDQLDTAHGGRRLAWLPAVLPPHCKIIVSTLPDDKYEAFPAFKTLVPDEGQHVGVPDLGEGEARTIVTALLEGRNRRLTHAQTDILLNTFKQNPTPLFLKLCVEEAILWRSFDAGERTVLETTVRAAVTSLFTRLEKMHGKMLTSRALGYLTLARNGITESELEDVLSCDDDVLNDVYMYWTPPMRRLPPLLLVRVRTDIDQYIAERGADGSRVLCWYHRQFIEAATDRYCSDPEQTKVMHANLADFFNGTWANGRKKAYTNASGQHLEEDRMVSDQPLRFGEKGEFNLRTLNNLPYHRMWAGQLQLLKDECLANIKFAVTKLQAQPVENFLDDYIAATSRFPDDELLQEVLQALLLSRKGMQTDQVQFVPQLLGRLADSPAVSEFKARLRAYDEQPWLEPHLDILERPGGQLIHCFSAHGSDVDMIDMSADGMYVVTVCQSEKRVKIWDMMSDPPRLLREVTGKAQCTAAYFCQGDTCVVAEAGSTIHVEEVKTGKLCAKFPYPGGNTSKTFCVAGPNKGLVVTFNRNQCLVNDIETQTCTHTLDSQLTFGSVSYPVAVCDANQYFITVLDHKTFQFIPPFRGFEKIPTDDGDFDEHEVEAISIHPDETHLMYTTLFTSEIVFADFHGNRLRSIPPNEQLSFNHLGFDGDGKHFWVTNNNFVIFYDTASLLSDIIGVRTTDSLNVVTISEDSNLRVWDRRRQKVTSTTCVEPFTPIKKYSTPVALPYHGYIFVHGTASGSSNDDVILGVYDVGQMKYVKLRTFVGLDGIRKFYPLDDRRLILGYNRKLHVLDLDTMTFPVTLQGIHDSNNSVFASGKNRLLCCTRGGHHLKAYTLDSGKVDFIIKTTEKKVAQELKVNEPGTVAAISYDEGPILVFDLVNRAVICTIGTEKYGEYFGTYLWLDDAGSRLFFSADMAIDQAIKEDVEHLIAWDVKENRELFRMFDLEGQRRHQLKKNDETTAIEDVFPLDKSRIITPCYDNLLSRLEGHRTSVKMALCPRAPYIVTYGCFSEEDCLMLWDKVTYARVATYSLDSEMDKAYWSDDGSYFYMTSNGIRDGRAEAGVVRWTVNYGDAHMAGRVPEAAPPIYNERGWLSTLQTCAVFKATVIFSWKCYHFLNAHICQQLILKDRIIYSFEYHKMLIFIYIF